MKKIRTTLFNVPVIELTETQASSELSELAEIIFHHDRFYYEQDTPEISDAEYDELRRQNDADSDFIAFCKPDLVKVILVREWSQKSFS